MGNIVYLHDIQNIVTEVVNQDLGFFFIGRYCILTKFYRNYNIY